MNEVWLWCHDNSEYATSLTFGRLYRYIEDEQAEETGMYRIIDDNEDSFLYPKKYFTKFLHEVKDGVIHLTSVDSIPKTWKEIRV